MRYDLQPPSAYVSSQLTQSLPSYTSTTPTPGVYNIYIRWVTPQRAFASSSLSQINTEVLPVLSNTSLSTLKTFAFNQLCAGPPSSSGPLCTSAELFLQNHYLSCNDSTTLSDLKLTGSFSEPLHIFVVPFKYQRSPDSYNTWGFECSERGAATFFNLFENSDQRSAKEAHAPENNLGRLMECHPVSASCSGAPRTLPVGYQKQPIVTDNRPCDNVPGTLFKGCSTVDWAE